jgi:hypothetical protein
MSKWNEMLELVLATILTTAGWAAAGPAPPAMDRIVAPAVESAPANRVTGRVIAVDVPHGVVIVTTPDGTVALHGSPEQVDQVSVGDIFVLEFDGRGDQPGPAAASDQVTA